MCAIAHNGRIRVNDSETFIGIIQYNHNVVKIECLMMTVGWLHAYTVRYRQKPISQIAHKLFTWVLFQLTFQPALLWHATMFSPQTYFVFTLHFPHQEICFKLGIPHLTSRRWTTLYRFKKCNIITASIDYLEAWWAMLCSIQMVYAIFMITLNSQTHFLWIHPKKLDTKIKFPDQVTSYGIIMELYIVSWHYISSSFIFKTSIFPR